MSRTISNFAPATRKRPKKARSEELRPPASAHELAGERFALITVRVEDAVDFTPAKLEKESFGVYEAIAERLAKSDCPHAVRFWNHVPSITDPADAGRDVYMVFN